MRNVITCASWLLYWLGDLVSRPMSRWDAFSWLYPAYNRLMLASSRLQDWGDGTGPWSDVVGEEN
jgi:hypothetical protein